GLPGDRHGRPDRRARARALSQCAQSTDPRRSRGRRFDRRSGHSSARSDPARPRHRRNRADPRAQPPERKPRAEPGRHPDYPADHGGRAAPRDNGSRPRDRRPRGPRIAAEQGADLGAAYLPSASSRPSRRPSIQPEARMVPRYARPAMTAIWEPEARYRIWFEIEAHATEKLG